MAFLPPARFVLPVVVAIMFLSLVPGGRVMAMPDSNFVTDEVPLAISRINSDCMLDTLVGRFDVRFNFVPTAIRWGGWDVVHAEICPPDTVPRIPLHASTSIQYDSWPNLTATAGIELLNGDSLTDVIFYFWGHIDTIDYADTGRAVVLFGQAKLDTLSSLDIGAVGIFQSTPFFALQLKHGVELTEPEIRDPSGITSYLLNPVDLVIPGNPPKQEVSAVKDPWIVQIYPNPAATSTQVEGRLIPEGEYAVEVISVNGEVERRQDVTVTETGELFRVIDLRYLASGYYLVRLHSGGKLFGTYPIIVRK